MPRTRPIEMAPPLAKGKNLREELDDSFKAPAGENGSQKAQQLDFLDMRTSWNVSSVRGDPCLPGGVGFDSLMHRRGQVEWSAAYSGLGL